MGAKNICILGEINSGKSSLGNVLLGLDLATSYGFHVSPQDESLISIIRHEMEHPDIRTGHWLGDDGKQVKLIHAPKHGQQSDETMQMRIVDCIKDETQIDAFIWVKNAQAPKFSCEDRDIFQIFLEKFGGQFLNNLVVVLTHWSSSSEADRRRKLTRASLDGVKKTLWESLAGKTSHTDKLPIVCIDAIHNKECPKEAAAFKAGCDELWNVISQKSASPVIDVNVLKQKVK